MKMKLFGWLIVAGLLYVCPNVMGQSLTVDLAGAVTTGPNIGGIATNKTAGADWGITSGSITISATGAVKGKISGLLIPVAGTATVTEISVVLVCGGTISGETGSFALSTTGDAKIKGSGATVPIPSGGCYGPQVLIVADTFQGATVPLADTNYIAAGSLGVAASTDAADSTVPKRRLPMDDLDKILHPQDPNSKQ
jgi:hypothetical protein